ncbi:MAG: asparagine synthase-related protein [Labilithrix sp.]
MFFCNGEQRTASLKAIVQPGAKPNPTYFAFHAAPWSRFDFSVTPYKGVYAAEAESSPPVCDLPSPGAVEDAAESVRHALELTLERQLGAANRVAVLTGGGLDSGGLLALVHNWARQRGKSCLAVGLSFEDAGDDRPYLSALEAHLECEVIRVYPEEGAPYWSRVIEGLDGAPQTWGNAPMELALYARARDAGAEVTVTGVGGDHLFDGDPRALAELVRKGRPLAALTAARSLRGFDRPISPVASWVLRPWLGSFLPRSAYTRVVQAPPRFIPSWAGPRLVRHLSSARREAMRSVHLNPEQRAKRRARQNRIFERQRQQIRLALGIDRIDPFLDESLLAFRDQLPPHWLLMGGIRRGLYREALRDLIPEALYRRESKSRFTGAFVRFSQALGGLEQLRDLAVPRMLASFDVVKIPPFRAEYESLCANQSSARGWGAVLPVILLEAFARHRFGG